LEKYSKTFADVTAPNKAIEVASNVGNIIIVGFEHPVAAKMAMAEAGIS
jgi:hypothetical protein